MFTIVCDVCLPVCDNALLFINVAKAKRSASCVSPSLVTIRLFGFGVRICNRENVYMKCLSMCPDRCYIGSCDV